jgi:hypothetical protein
MRTILLCALLAGCASTSSGRKEDSAAPVVASGRCEALFDALRPGLEKQWEANVTMDVYGRMRDKMPELKQVFSRECTTALKPDDLACAEGDNRQMLEGCASQPAETQQACRDEAEQNRNNPLYCKAVSELLERTGASWMKTHGLDR